MCGVEQLVRVFDFAASETPAERLCLERQRLLRAVPCLTTAPLFADFRNDCGIGTNSVA